MLYLTSSSILRRLPSDDPLAPLGGTPEIHKKKTPRSNERPQDPATVQTPPGGAGGEGLATKQRGRREAIQNKRAQGGEDRRQYREEGHRPYKSRGHRGGKIGDNTERKGRGHINKEGTAGGGKASIQGGKALAKNIKRAQRVAETQTTRAGKILAKNH